MVTSIKDIKKNQVIEVELPGWGVTDTFVCKVKRVNLMDLIAKGNIPNPLMNTVINLFKGSAISDEEDVLNSKESYKKYIEVSELFANSILVEPTLKELHENDIELTDEQRNIFYQFAMFGIKALIPYTRKPSNTVYSGDGERESQKAK